MTYTAPVVSYSTTLNGTYTTITGIQNVQIRRGRMNFQDNFPQTLLTVELIPANSYATPFAVGQFIDVRESNSASAKAWFCGQITDVQRTYEMPYNSSTGAAPADRIVLTATGALGFLGSTQLVNVARAAGESAQTARTLGNSLNVASVISAYPSAPNSAGTFNGSALDAINGLARTAQQYLDDVDSSRTVLFGALFRFYMLPSGFAASNAVIPSFRDNITGTPPANQYRFGNLEFLSSAETRFTKSVVEPDGLATQEATTGSAPYNTINYSTFNSTTADALSLANYLVSLLSGIVQAAPYSIATNTAIAPNCMQLGQLYLDSLSVPLIGNEVEVVFRGSTVSGIVQGMQMNFTQEYGSIRLFVSPTLGAPFRLNSDTQGVLGTNRLGYP